MKIKLLITALMICLGLTASVYAQNQTRADHRLEQLKVILSLSDEQAVKVKDILSRAEEETAREIDANPKNKRKLRQISKVRMQEMDKEIEAILTPEQLKIYESYKIERKSEMKGRRKGTKFYRE